MKYPSAQKGVNLLWIASLIGIIISVVAVIGAIVSGVALSDETIKKASLGVVGGAGLAALALFIIQLIGLVEARKDERGFHLSLMAVLIAIILGVIGAIFNAFDKEVLKIIGRVFDLLSNISSLASLSFIFLGIMNLSQALNNVEMVQKGRRLLHIIWIVFAASMILGFVSVVLPESIGDWVKVLIAVFAIASAILEVVSSILTFLYYGRAKEMLKQ